MSFLTGTKGRYRQIPTIEKAQQPLKQQLFGASQGAFGSAADYYRSLLADDNSTFSALAAPEMRQFREDIIPSLAEQFAAMGASGSGLSGHGFAKAAGRASADLGERLASIRAQLRQQAAQGLMGIGQAGLQPFFQNVYEEGSPGLLQSLAPIAGAALGSFGGPIGSALGSKVASWITGNMKKGSTSPYGNTQQRMASGEYAGPGY